MANIFLTPSQIIAGAEALKQAGPTLKTFGNKALVVTDDMMIKLGNIAKLEAVLQENNIDYTLFSKINSEPNDQMIIEGVKAYKANQCDFLIGLGGGSPIDSAKAIGMMSSTSEPIASFMGKLIDVKMPNLVAIPTTAGTGSEATKFTIINDTASQVKMLLTGPCLIPKLAIIDPAFTLTAPVSVTANTGVDALCHAIEAYTSKKAQPLSDTFALSAIKRIFNNLVTCCKEPTNQEARIQMSLAALEAGMAFNNASVTVVHGMSRPIGALFHVPHGLSNAMLLNDCMAYVVDGAYERFGDIARYVGFTTSKDNQEASEIFLKELNNLLTTIHIPTMSEYGIDKEKYDSVIDKMANDALASGSPGNTLKDLTKEDLVKLYKQIYK